jgi:integrase/recombinase XerD
MYLANGGDVYKLSRSLGHSEIGITEEYLKDFKSRDARKDHDNYSPINQIKQGKNARLKKSEKLFE